MAATELCHEIRCAKNEIVYYYYYLFIYLFIYLFLFCQIKSTPLKVRMPNMALS